MRLLLIEDDRKIANFVRRGLREAGFAVDHAENGVDGLDLLLAEPYDVAVIDIMLPGLDGLSIIEKMRNRLIKTPVLVLSAKGTVDDRIKGLQTGADDYLTKPFSFSELLARVQALIRRSSGSAEPTRLSFGDLSMDLLTRTVRRGDKVIDLMPKEFELLQYLLLNAGKVVSKTALLEHVWGYDFDPQTNAVDVLVCRVRGKIDRDFDTKILHTLRGVGYVLKIS
ncbi:MAG: response regulator transcription factor [Smithella sp.]|nr:response regulator transcription factor [Smithella sp.]HOU50759.1 response regulator transcription factor [Smithella sp.]HQG65282.1 response regulator transcription factor [Smithella sp.]HQH16282.1 response regulator transcription factor [Smithella sp.]HQI71957.1 response regulator transcription factor [Smithella sp.]